MAARLKVFTARQGFFETVVAAPSQKAALQAWGVRQDLFKEGQAAVADDPAAQAALDQPGVVLRRMAGSNAPFAADATVGAAVLPPRPKPKRGKPKAAPDSPPPVKPPPDRSALSAAEAALATDRRDLEAGMQDLADRRRALDQEEASLVAYHERRRRELETALERARVEYRRAGGSV